MSRGSSSSSFNFHKTSGFTTIESFSIPDDETTSSVTQGTCSLSDSNLLALRRIEHVSFHLNSAQSEPTRLANNSFFDESYNTTSSDIEYSIKSYRQLKVPPKKLCIRLRTPSFNNSLEVENRREILTSPEEPPLESKINVNNSENASSTDTNESVNTSSIEEQGLQKTKSFRNLEMYNQEEITHELLTESQIIIIKETRDLSNSDTTESDTVSDEEQARAKAFHTFLRSTSFENLEIDTLWPLEPDILIISQSEDTLSMDINEPVNNFSIEEHVPSTQICIYQRYPSFSKTDTKFPKQKSIWTNTQQTPTPNLLYENDTDWPLEPSTLIIKEIEDMSSTDSTISEITPSDESINSPRTFQVSKSSKRTDGKLNNTSKVDCFFALIIKPFFQKIYKGIKVFFRLRRKKYFEIEYVDSELPIVNIKESRMMVKTVATEIFEAQGNTSSTITISELHSEEEDNLKYLLRIHDDEEICRSYNQNVPSASRRVKRCQSADLHFYHNLPIPLTCEASVQVPSRKEMNISRSGELESIDTSQSRCCFWIYNCRDALFPKDKDRYFY